MRSFPSIYPFPSLYIPYEFSLCCRNILESLFKIHKISYLMEGSGKPDPRWNEFIEQFDLTGKAIGFKLPGNDFVFRLDEEGGWYDEKGKYFNADGVLEEESQRDEEDEEEEDELSDDEDIDQFERLLREEEEGVVRKPKREEGTKPSKEEEAKPPKEDKKDKTQFDYAPLLEQYKSKERLREGLPAELFIYFKQKTDFYQNVTPSVEKEGSVQFKNAAVKKIQAVIQEARKKLLEQNVWLNGQDVYLDYSGDSQTSNTYDRYWFGAIKTTPEAYLGILSKIKDSKEFKVLEIKTFYALKSKFYLKKAQEKVKETIGNIRDKISVLDESKVVSLLIDGLPEQFPCSFIYDLVEYSGGKLEHVESVIIEDDFSATVTCLKPTALSLINIEGYNHDKGEFIEISFNQAKERAYAQGKAPFYFITVDSEYKVHESELHDTLGLEFSKAGLARHFSNEEDKKDNIRFAVGSVQALRKVLMFRGVTLNVTRVLPSIPK